MFAILAEDKSDYAMLKEIVRSICDDKSVPVIGKGFGSGSELLKDGARELNGMAKLKAVRTVFICHDADSLDPAGKSREVMEKVIKPASLNGRLAICVVPVAMIESWILADVNACRKVFTSLPLVREIENPENIRHAKTEIEAICRAKAKPLYSNATHNKLIAPHLDLQKVYKRCPSFRSFATAVDRTFGRQRPPEYWAV
ncbi:DUF4276 family protein [Acidovorax sp. NCPPB 4044]|uniref:DUF4276 family protein n=1 Tax=Acidovorax sp. NCPPB 4044 TaxID=2940490 RepID=UPI00230202DA|nr:DUF4276 family protein [Acidovorax sp. NCPPB 4044]MDA8521345.1 DUF4276 family protein [Acidovorax sp. NCPPB 4044]